VRCPSPRPRQRGVRLFGQAWKEKSERRRCSRVGLVFGAEHDLHKARVRPPPCSSSRTLSGALLHILGWNEIGAEGASAVAEALKVNSTLRWLVLLENDIGSEGASAIACALKGNSTLQRLDLGANNVGDKGASALSEALRMNSTLETLHLSRNHIGAAGASALADALRTNSACALNALFLGRNTIGPSGAAALGDALTVNGTLQHIMMGRGT